MPIGIVRRLAAITLASGGMALPIAAQTGAIAGQVTERTTGVAVASAFVTARGVVVRSALTGNDGRYQLSGLPTGTYSLQVRRIGLRALDTSNVSVRAGETTSLDLATQPAPTILEREVVTGTPGQGQLGRSPTSVGVVPEEKIETTPSVTVADQVGYMPGVVRSQGGIGQAMIVARGFNNAFSGALLMLQDFRFAGVPSLRVNVPFLLTSTNEDIQRIEIVNGPAAAVYGPNSTSGVMHVITRSPFDRQGTTFTIDGGGQSILRTSLRHADVVGKKFGYKISGEYMTGEDFEYHDPGEPATVNRGGRQVSRDFNVKRYLGEARVDFRPRPGAEFTTTYGFTHAGSAIELTGANGAAQVKNWRYQSVQQRMQWGNLFAQAFLNMSDAGNRDASDTRGTFLLRNGQSIVDESRVAAGSIKHELRLGGRQRFIYGGDYIWTNPRTGGTINGRNEDDDNVREIGGYLHSITALTPRLDLVAAIRVDDNNRIDGTFYSPRAGLLFSPTPQQNFRVTFDRAYSTPANFSFFLDLLQVSNPGGLPYEIRAVGVPPGEGWTYARSCNASFAGGHCMRSPFPGPAAPNTLVDANATAYYRAVVAAVAPRVPASLAPIIQILNNSAAPTSSQVSTVLRNLTSPTSVVAPSSLTDIEPLKASFVNNYEVGYRGTLGSRGTLSVNAWYQQRINFITPAQIVTPSAFMDPTSLAAFLSPTIYAGLRAQGMPDAQAQAATAAAVPPLTAALAQIPTGTVTFNNPRLANDSDILFTYRNVEKTIALFGSEMAFEQNLTDLFSVAGTYSWISKTKFFVGGGLNDTLRTNSPQHMASLTAAVDSKVRGLRFELRGRYSDAFKVNSGVYATDVQYPSPGSTGTYTYPSVPTATVIDAGFTYRPPRMGGGVIWAINVNNLLNHPSPTFIGVPAMGRLIMTRLSYTLGS